jgi:hypothetical protein
VSHQLADPVAQSLYVFPKSARVDRIQNLDRDRECVVCVCVCGSGERGMERERERGVRVCGQVSTRRYGWRKLCREGHEQPKAIRSVQIRIIDALMSCRPTLLPSFRFPAGFFQEEESEDEREGEGGRRREGEGGRRREGEGGRGREGGTESRSRVEFGVWCLRFSVSDLLCGEWGVGNRGRRS